MGHRHSRHHHPPPPRVPDYNFAAAVNIIGPNNSNNVVMNSINRYQTERSRMIAEHSPYSSQNLSSIPLKSIYRTRIP
jgi:hypothetical protein